MNILEHGQIISLVNVIHCHVVLSEWTRLGIVCKPITVTSVRKLATIRFVDCSKSSLATERSKRKIVYIARLEDKCRSTRFRYERNQTYVSLSIQRKRSPLIIGNNLDVASQKENLSNKRCDNVVLFPSEKLYYSLWSLVKQTYYYYLFILDEQRRFILQWLVWSCSPRFSLQITAFATSDIPDDVIHILWSLPSLLFLISELPKFISELTKFASQLDSDVICFITAIFCACIRVIVVRVSVLLNLHGVKSKVLWRSGSGTATSYRSRVFEWTRPVYSITRSVYSNRVQTTPPFKP